MIWFKRLLIYIYSTRNRIILNHKINGIYKDLSNPKNLKKDLLRQHIKLWSPINKKVNTRWYKVFYNINNNSDPNYISETDYYNSIEPVLNHKSFCDAYSDKNFYHKILDNDLLPKVHLRRIHGDYYSEDYSLVPDNENLLGVFPKDRERLIIKKAFDSGGGSGVGLLSKIDNKWYDHNNELVTRKYLEYIYGFNFVIQEYLNQHQYFKQFNESSVNTIRLLTYRSVISNEIIPLQAVLRIGKKGSFVDNQASGGIACGIDDFGKLNSFAVNKQGEKIETFNGINFSMADEIFGYSKIIEIGLEIAKLFQYQRLLGFDFIIVEDGKIKIIEINNKNNEINFYQMSNGPLFKTYTKEIIDYCSEHKKTYQFDFENY